MVVKTYAVVLLDHEVESTGKSTHEEKCGFREDKSCSDKIFVARKILHKMKTKEK